MNNCSSKTRNSKISGSLFMAYPYMKVVSSLGTCEIIMFHISDATLEVEKTLISLSTLTGRQNVKDFAARRTLSVIVFIILFSPMCGRETHIIQIP